MTDKIDRWKQGEKIWECREQKSGIACNFKGGTGEDGRTVLMDDDGRTRIHDNENDVEVGWTGED